MRDVFSQVKKRFDKAGNTMYEIWIGVAPTVTGQYASMHLIYSRYQPTTVPYAWLGVSKWQKATTAPHTWLGVRKGQAKRTSSSPINSWIKQEIMWWVIHNVTWPGITSMRKSHILLFGSLNFVFPMQYFTYTSRNTYITIDECFQSPWIDLSDNMAHLKNLSESIVSDSIVSDYCITIVDIW